jgi:hypothetical protein
MEQEQEEMLRAETREGCSCVGFDERENGLSCD